MASPLTQKDYRQDSTLSWRTGLSSSSLPDWGDNQNMEEAKPKALSPPKSDKDLSPPKSDSETLLNPKPPKRKLFFSEIFDRTDDYCSQSSLVKSLLYFAGLVEVIELLIKILCFCIQPKALVTLLLSMMPFLPDAFLMNEHFEEPMVPIVTTVSDVPSSMKGWLHVGNGDMEAIGSCI